MDIIRYVLIVVEVLTCLLLIGVILLQQSKSQGMGTAFGGGMSETLFGSRAGNVLTKITVTLALIFLANTTVLGILFTARQDKSLVELAPLPAQAPLPVTPRPASGPELMTTPQQAPMPFITEAPSETIIMPTEVQVFEPQEAMEVEATMIEEVEAPETPAEIMDEDAAELEPVQP